MQNEWLEPKLLREVEEANSIRIICQNYNKLLPEKAKKTYYAKYRVIKKFPTPETKGYDEEDREYLEEGGFMLEQVVLPHQDIGIHCGFGNEYILEALAKGYLDFVGLEIEGE